MSSPKADDLDAVRQIANILDPFPVSDRERILRWVRERLGMEASTSTAHQRSAQPLVVPPATSSQTGKTVDIKSFIEAKSPKKDVHFAAAVAYYYRFEAPQDERKEFITADVLIDACRKVSRKRPPTPGQTLVHAATAGYLDQTGERGQYRINSVGENLVAMVLPTGNGTSAGARKKKNARRGAKKRGR